MILYAASTVSSFTMRPRLAVYAKGLDIPIRDVPGGSTTSPEYLAINPLGRVPALELDDGTVIAESEVIVEYLEDRFPQKPLRPASPEDRARARTIARICDFYIFEQGRPLLAQMNPATRDQAVVDTTFAALDQGLEQVAEFMGPGPYAIGASLTTADCALATMAYVLEVMGAAFGRPDILTRLPRLAAYMAFIPGDPHIARVRDEMRQGWAARMADL